MICWQRSRGRATTDHWFVRLRPTVTVLSLLMTLTSGCSSGNLRVQSIDRLWAALAIAHPNIEVNQDASALRAELRGRAATVRSEREFIILLAQSVDWLGDPHLIFTNLPEYWQKHIGRNLRSVCDEVAMADGRMWVQFSPNSVVPEKSGITIPPQAMYQLISVEDVRAGPIAAQLLLAEPGQQVNVTMLSADGTEYSVCLHVQEDSPAEPKNVSASQPSSRPTTASAASSPTSRERIQAPVGYISIARLASKNDVENFDAQLEQFFDSKALIIDLRDNPGGNIGVTSAILGRFVVGRQPYAFLQSRKSGWLLGGITFPLWYTVPIIVSNRDKGYHRRIVVVIDSSTQSAAELLTLGLRDLRGAIVVGGHSGGAGAGIQDIVLPNGLGLQFGRLPIKALDGRSHQGTGVLPDVRIALDPRAVAKDGSAAIQRWWLKTTIEAYKTAAKAAGCEDDPIVVATLEGFERMESR